MTKGALLPGIISDQLFPALADRGLKAGNLLIEARFAEHLRIRGANLQRLLARLDRVKRHYIKIFDKLAA